MSAEWQRVALGELCTLVSGQHIEAKNYNSVGRGVGYLTGPSDFGPVSPIISKWTEHPKVMAQRGDILITVKGSGVGKINWLDESNVAISRQLMAIRVVGASPRFVHTVLSSTFEHFQTLSTGAAIPGISRDQVLGLKIALPPIDRQRRIVAILDEAFEGIATAKANAEKNLLNARELVDNFHRDLFSRAGNTENMQLLGDIASFRNGINFTKQSKGRSIPIVGVKDFRNHFWAPMDSLDAVTMDGDLNDADSLVEGDILSVRSNGNPALIGRCMLIGEMTEPAVHSGFTIKIRLLRDDVLPEYVCQFLKSPGVRRQLIDGGNGANIKSLNQGTLAAIKVPLPEPKEQRRLVAEIETMSQEGASLVGLQMRKLTALAALKKSLLHQAFSGAL